MQKMEWVEVPLAEKTVDTSLRLGVIRIRNPPDPSIQQG